MKYPNRFAQAFLALWLLVLTLSAGAHERFGTAAQFQALGFQPATSAREGALSKAEPKSGTPWPVQFADAAHTIAQNYVQFQDYGDGAYYHGGCDLRAQAHSAVIAPVDGVLEGGYYGYENHPDGSDSKFWKPWDGAPHDDPYFELAIVTEDGFRYELHHVDSMDLPQSTITALNRGGVNIVAGTPLGKVFEWGQGGYNHVHFNVIRNDKIKFNPELYSLPTVTDHQAPIVRGIYAISVSGQVTTLKAGTPLKGPIRELIVAATDSRENSVYVQTPIRVQALFSDGRITGYDWTRTLRGPSGEWPDIRQAFLAVLKTPEGETLQNEGNYGAGLFLIRLPVPAGAQGDVRIQVADTAGNSAMTSTEIRGF